MVNRSGDHGAVPPCGRDATRTRWYALALVALALMAYSTSYTGVFVFDDELRLSHLTPETRILDALTNSSRPLTDVSFYVNYRAFGLHAGAFRIGNIMIHIGAGLVLFGLLHMTFRGPTLAARYGRYAHRIAFGIAAFWMVHPLQTASVTYVVQRSECFTALFLFATLLLVARSRTSEHPSRGHAAAIVACALGMASKPTMVSAPLIVLLYDRFFMAGDIKGAWRDRRPLYIGLAATWIIPMALLAVPHESSSSTGLGPLTPSFAEYIMTQPEVVLHYLKLALIPYPLTFDYYWTPVQHWQGAVPAGLALIILLGATVTTGLWKRPEAFGAAWMFIWLAPTSSVIPITDCAVEHRMYIPLAGFAFMLGASASRLQDWASETYPDGLFAHYQLLSRGVVIALCALTFMTATRNRVFRSADRLWLDVIAKRPDNLRAYVNLADAYMRQGEPEKVTVVCRLLIDKVKHIAAMDPAEIPALPTDWQSLEVHRGAIYYAHACNFLGVVSAKRGAFDEAIDCFEEALRMQPGYGTAKRNLATARADRTAAGTPPEP